MVYAVFHLCTPSWSWRRCPEIGTSSIDWAQQSRFFLKMETIQSPKHCVLKNKQDGGLDKDKMMDNVQKHNICTNVPLSQTFRSYLSMIQLGQNASVKCCIVSLRIIKAYWIYSSDVN
jgi:hypothetical protein